MRKLIIIFLIISYPVYLGFDFMVWNEKVMKACDSVVGLNFFELSGRMKHEGFKVTDANEQGVAIIHTTRNMGRGVCIMEIKEGVVDAAVFDMD